LKNKIFVLLLISLISTLLSGLYGVLHNQITYSISPEFYTKFLFYRFGLDEYFTHSQRIGASLVGFLSSWWVGLAAGLTLGSVGFIYHDGKIMFKQTLKAISLVLLAAVLTLLTTFIYGLLKVFKDSLSAANYEQYVIRLPEDIPENVIIQDPYPFYLVGLIHDFSYFGGLLGLLLAIAFLIGKYKKGKPATGLQKNLPFTT
jgi:hypothetical protein